jgi:hypothetical protein
MRAFRGILGEHISDAESLANIIRRIEEKLAPPRIAIKKHGFGGCARLLSNGAGMLKAWERAGCIKAIICYDADNDPNQSIEYRKELIEKQVIARSGVKILCHPIIPVQELEGWWHGDIAALSQKYSWSLNQAPGQREILLRSAQ